MIRLSAIAKATGGRLIGGDVSIRGAAIDSRKLKAGELFVAISGTRVDGHDYLAQAAAGGAAGALVMRAMASPLPQVVVRDTTLALGVTAKLARAEQRAKVIGITGSNGKTTVRTLTTAILARHGLTHSNAGNFNNELGLPLSLLAMPVACEYAVLEMGAGKPGDIAYLAEIAQPQVALVNNVAAAHLLRLGSLEGVADTKGALYSALPADGVAVINADDRFADYFAGRVGQRRIIRYALGSRAEVGADIVEQRFDGSFFVLSTPEGDAEVNLPLPGRHNIANALAASALALALAVPLESIVAGLEQASGVSGRLQCTAMPGDWILVDDSYNANPASVGAAIDTLRLAQGEHWLVLGDLGELGDAARELHADIGQRARAAGIAHLFAVGPLSVAAVEAFGDGAQHFSDKPALLAALKARLHAGVICLVKGSRAAAMDEVVRALQGVDRQEDTHAH